MLRLYAHILPLKDSTDNSVWGKPCIFCQILYNVPMNVLATILPWAQISLAVILIVFILLQKSGSGIGALGGDISVTHHTKRGFEKFLFSATIVIAILFAASAFTAILLK